MKHKVGSHVKVIQAIDETCLPEQVGKTGIISAHNSNELTCNTKEDPLHIVQFDDGSEQDGFWFEELELIRQS